MSPEARPPEHPANSTAFRASLRRDKLSARMALNTETHAALSARIEMHLERVLRSLSPGLIGFCAPVRNEFDARPLVGRLLAEGWRAAMPVAERTATAMRFRPWLPDAAMTTDPFGIAIPADTADAGQPDVILLPLVAFDLAGYRLGYGGGYFDRTLSALTPRPCCIGVGFELARVESIHPEPHDQRLDAMITESGFRAVASGRSGVAFTAIPDDHRA